MAGLYFDEETDLLLSQLDMSALDTTTTLSTSQTDLTPLDFDNETSFAMSQFDLDAFLKNENGFVNQERTERYGKLFTDVDVEELRKASTPINTVKSTIWGVNAWDSWGKWRNDRTILEGLKESTPYVLVPPLTVDLKAHELNYWLCRFVIEVRRQDGKEYPSESLRQLCVSIWRYLRDTCPRYDLNFFDRKKVEFADARECLDSRMKTLDSGNSTKKRQAEPISTAEEDLLWTVVFEKESSLHLQYAVYFYCCKIFGLRASDEHTNLTVDQFEFGSDESGDFVCFKGGKAKTVQGGIFHKKVNAKVVKQYADNVNPRCVVNLLQKYLSLIPNEGPFYRRPLAKEDKDGNPRFSHQKVGIHALQRYMERMCTIAGVTGYKTGHSGKVTTATSLYQQGFDEQLIAGRTGHRSNANRAYKRTSNDQLKAVSEALQPPLPKKQQVSSDMSDSKNHIEIEKNGTTIKIFM